MAGYYYRQLDREKRAVYDAMRTGMEALAPGIRVPKLTGQELSDIYLRLKLDTPLLFYVTGFQYRWMPGADHVELLPEYLFDKSKVRQHRQAVAARLDRLVRPLAGKTDREKELAIHGFILENVRYDKLKKPYSHEIIGPLTQGVGVCEGIAKTVKALCDAVGLPCIVALSEAAPERGVKYRHTWNVVTVEGQRYHLDATFDNSLQRGVPRYDYFNLDDRHIFRDHETLVLPLPPCTADKGYYYRALSFTKPEGGMFLWATLPEGINTMDLFPKALERNVAFVPGEPFYAEPGARSTMRLNFTNADEETIRDGIRRLAEAIAEAL